jgi:cytochrome c oxidase subunit I
VIVSLIGGIVLAVSALLFVYNLAMLHRRGPRAALGEEVPYAEAVHPPGRLPSSLNGFGMWNVIVAVLMALAYGYPIAQFFIDPPPQAVVHRLTG